jgi:hypothetical protein
MAACVEPDENDVLVLTTTPPDQCPGYVVLTSGEYGSTQTALDLFFPPISYGDAWMIAAAVWSLWATAWLARPFFRAMRPNP